MENWKISRKLLAAFAVVVLTLGGVAGIVSVNLSAIRRASEASLHVQDVLAQVDGLTKSMLDLSGQVRGFLLTRDEAFAKGVEADHLGVQRGIATLRAELRLAEQRARLEKIAQAAEAYVVEAGDPEIKAGRDPATLAQGIALINTGINKRDMNGFKSAVDDFENAERRFLTLRQAQQANAIATARLALIVGITAAIGLSCLLGFLLTRMIATPVRAMTETMRRLASGDHAVVVPGRGRRDEVGEMAGAVQTFKEAAIDKVRLENEAATARDAVEQQQRINEAARARAAQEQTQVVERLAQGLSKLSAGDLSHTLHEPFAAAYEGLRADFNSAVESLRQAMSAISEATGGINHGADEISTASDDLSRRTEQQAASLEETAAALDEITATVKNSASSAEQASAVVSSAKDDATLSGEVVRQAVSAMGAIERSSGEITQIISVIDEIAFQTNLLALNAGVEAARAGEAGRGFAVVAQEVRALAQRSAEAAKEIKGLIASSSSEVKRGAQLVGETGTALTGIVVKVTEIDALVAGIASSTREQALGLAQVNTAVNEMDQVTQQNAAMVEEATAAAGQLKTEALELSRLVSRFGTDVRDGKPAGMKARGAKSRAAA
ncbi:MAG: methyl-accepting chemotaxis protein [Proteobacteria bacterium]|nr:methyl-accepting chemotaxis protein [Pseudomonadota bacterium]